MSGKDTLTAFAKEHQSREIEFRRLQNCYAAETATAYVGVVDTSWSDLAEEDDPDELKVPHFGVIPISSAVKSNWHIGNDVPFVLDPSRNPGVSPADGELNYVWVTFRATSSQGFLFVHPDGERVFVKWDDEGSSSCGKFVFRAFKDEAAARYWVTLRAEQLIHR